jgi:hypothetical protein
VSGYQTERLRAIAKRLHNGDVRDTDTWWLIQEVQILQALLDNHHARDVHNPGKETPR